jgi:hypothetical protein
MVKFLDDPWHTKRDKVNALQPCNLGAKKLVEELKNGLGFACF